MGFVGVRLQLLGTTTSSGRNVGEAAGTDYSIGKTFELFYLNSATRELREQDY